MIAPPFAHLKPIFPGNTILFTRKQPLGLACTNFTWFSNPDAGSIDNTGKFTTSSKLGTYYPAVWAKDKNVQWQWISNYAKVVIANNFYPVNLKVTGTGTGSDANKFIFQPIKLEWAPNPGTGLSGITYRITYKYGWTGKEISANVGNVTYYTLLSDTIEYFAEGDWFWTVSSIIDGVTYDQLYPQYDASLKITKATATNFNDQYYPKVTITNSEYFFGWKPVAGIKSGGDKPFGNYILKIRYPAYNTTYYFVAINLGPGMYHPITTCCLIRPLCGCR